METASAISVCSNRGGCLVSQPELRCSAWPGGRMHRSPDWEWGSWHRHTHHFQLCGLRQSGLNTKHILWCKMPQTSKSSIWTGRHGQDPEVQVFVAVYSTLTEDRNRGVRPPLPPSITNRNQTSWTDEPRQKPSGPETNQQRPGYKTDQAEPEQTSLGSKTNWKPGTRFKCSWSWWANGNQVCEQGRCPRGRAGGTGMGDRQHTEGEGRGNTREAKVCVSVCVLYDDDHGSSGCAGESHTPVFARSKACL